MVWWGLRSGRDVEEDRWWRVKDEDSLYELSGMGF
jgi:hypothetical protein